MDGCTSQSAETPCNGIALMPNSANFQNLKPERESCAICSTTTWRLFSLNNSKCWIVNATAKLEQMAQFGTGSLEHLKNELHLCQKCLDYTIEHETKVQRAQENIRNLMEGALKRHKRSSSTSPMDTVAENLAASVDRMKRMRVSESSIPVMKCKRKISFEHTYSQHSSIVEENDGSFKIQAEEYISKLPESELFGDVEAQLTSMSNVRSELFQKDAKSLSDENLFNRAIIEFKKSCPLLFNILLVAFSKIKNPTSKIATLATVYGMILHSRNNRVSAIQRMYSTIVLACNADNKLLTKLNAVHITLTENSKRSLVDTYGKESEGRVLQALSTGRDGKFNGDNLDIRVHVGDIRLTSKDRDYHFFASDFTVDRVDLSGLSKIPNANQSFEVTEFVPNNNEYISFKKSLKILLARDLSQYQGFQWMQSLLPQHIHHDYAEVMAKKSEMFLLPVSLNNEARYQDCIHILDEYEQHLSRWYTKTGRGGELEKLQVPVGGDQLTRVRLQGAKSLRAGAHTLTERLDHLQPMVIEMFHTLQDFLEKLCKKFLDLSNARDKGTLANLKVFIQRVNVNGNVKSRFKAHEDFVLTCGKGYYYSFILDKFKMKTMEDTPQHPAIKQTIKNCTNQHKEKVFHHIMDEVVADLFIPFDLEATEEQVTVTVGNDSFDMSAESRGDALTIRLMVNNKVYAVKTTAVAIQKGIKVQICGTDILLKATTGKKTSLKAYVQNFLQWYFVIIQMKDAIKEGDMSRTNIILKHMIPFFYSHSTLSKYLVECIDYILKTEQTLSPYMALKVRAATFVNIKGRPGKNKAADLQKENQVKYLKSLIRSLGANKTEQSIVRITKAGPVILDILDNYDMMTDTKVAKTTHKSKCRDEDIRMIVDKLIDLKVWDQGEDIRVNVLHGHTPFQFDRSHFRKTVESTIQRLLMDIPVIDEEEEDADED